MQLGNLYFVAFQAANGQWYEFQPEDNRPLLFSNTIMLPYTGRYPNDGTNSQITVGRDRLASVINSLASFNPNNPNNRQLLLTLIVMFPEAVRFTRVADFVYARMHDPSTPESGIGTMLARLVQEWGALSMEMRRSDLFASFRELDVDGLGISSASQAALALGIALWSSKGPPTGPAFSTNALSDVTSKGRQLVEIFWVQILNIDNENPGDLYGKIQVVDGLTTPQYIFNRSRENYLSIGPKGFVPLTGPTRAISAYDSFYIDVSLMDYDTLSSDDEVSRGQMPWNYFSINVYDQPLSAEVKGQYGSIGVSYAVYSNAVTATVQVTLINGDNENPANVYGTINAFNTLSNGTIALFNKNNKNYVDIKPLQLIPMLRSVVVVPLTSSIKVVADLWDQDTSSADDPIAQGSVTFAAANSGSNVGKISGTYGVVQVNVTWSSSWA
ncbi:60 kDa jasmonate-induced protein-like [Carex rostrata]